MNYDFSLTTGKKEDHSPLKGKFENAGIPLLHFVHMVNIAAIFLDNCLKGNMTSDASIMRGISPSNNSVCMLSMFFSNMMQSRREVCELHVQYCPIINYVITYIL